MENFVILILGVIFFIFRTYMNYKKEQEEASARNPSVPRQTTSSPSGEKVLPTTLGVPKWLEEFLPPQQPVQRAKPIQQIRPVERRSEAVLVTEASSHRGSIAYEPVKYTPTELPADLLSEYRNLPDKKEIEELKKSVAIHKAHNHQFKRLDPFVLAEKVEEIDVPAFNLREAIIMNAILERPYR